MGQPNWFIDILRILFRFIDYVAYWLVNNVYQLFIKISETGVFSPQTIGEFAGRIYALLGIFMLFKVTFSLITYILNPDSFTDKNKGIGKLLTNFFVVLIGIVAVPYVFQAAYSLQAVVLKENVIGNLIMGASTTAASNGENYIQKGGSIMSFTTLSAFVRLNPNLVDEECVNNPIVIATDAEGNIEYDDEGYPKNVDLSEACKNNSKSSALEATVNDGSLVKELLVEAYRTNNVELFTLTDLVTLKSVDDKGVEFYVMDYTVVISTIAGGFLAWTLLLFCIDIATRSVKLGFLQLIAPIPIISYVDPKGQDLFKKWLKECGKTYGDLFVRLVAIYFVIFIISELGFDGGYYNIVSGQNQAINSFSDVLVRVFIIFGALMFAKQLPELISNITGVKLSGGGFTLNPMKKLGQSPYAAGAMGLVGGAIGGGIANAYAAHKNGLGFGKGLASTLGGVVGGGRRGLMAGATSGGKGSLFDGAVKGITDSSARRNLRKFGQDAKGYSTWDMVADKAATVAGVKYSGGTSSALKSEINQLQQRLANAKMNEQNNASALQHRISEQQGHMKGLMETFNWSYERNPDGSFVKDDKGNLKFETKSWMKYGEEAGKAEALALDSSIDWDSLSEGHKKAYIQMAADAGTIVQESVFEELNGLYQNRIAADAEGKAIEKQIKDMQEDMDKFKGGSKKTS